MSITFIGENWVITPEALALNQKPPATISQQKFIMQLTGVVGVNIQGTVANDWLCQTITINPDSLVAAMNYAITTWGIPKPQIQGNFFNPVFSLDQWAPFAAVSSTWYKDSGAVDIGFAVDDWRPTHFTTPPDQNNQPIPNVFNGIDVDIAVMNTKGVLQRLSYSITLVGRIAFTPNTLF